MHAIDAARQVYSFDHHAGCIRHATLATCEQVRDAIRHGLDPDGFTVYLNDVDGDSVLSLWLLLHPDCLAGPASRRLDRMIHRLGRIDALGPGASPVPRLMHALDYPRDRVRGRDLLDEALATVDTWWAGGDLPPVPRPTRTLALWIEDGELCTGTVRGDFRGLYRRASFGVLAEPGPENKSTAYTVGKRSEFVAFDVPAFLEACNAIEPGWGGGSTIGGAPRNEDGSRSRLDVQDVGRILLEVARSR